MPRRIRLGLDPARPGWVVVSFVAIVFPLKWLQVGKVVRAALVEGPHVVNFPAPLFGSTVSRPLHGGPAHVLSEPHVRLRSPLGPDGFNGFLIESASIAVRARCSSHGVAEVPGQAFQAIG